MIITVADPLINGCGTGVGGAGGMGIPTVISAKARAAGKQLTITVMAQGGKIGVGAGNIGGMQLCMSVMRA